MRELRAYQVTPHVARKVHSAIDRRTTRYPGYAVSQIKRKRVEEIFGWMKTIGGLRKTRHRGADRVGWVFTFVAPPTTWSGCATSCQSPPESIGEPPAPATFNR